MGCYCGCDYLIEEFDYKGFQVKIYQDLYADVFREVEVPGTLYLGSEFLIPKGESFGKLSEGLERIASCVLSFLYDKSKEEVKRIGEEYFPDIIKEFTDEIWERWDQYSIIYDIYRSVMEEFNEFDLDFLDDVCAKEGKIVFNVYRIYDNHYYESFSEDDHLDYKRGCLIIMSLEDYRRWTGKKADKITSKVWNEIREIMQGYAGIVDDYFRGNVCFYQILNQEGDVLYSLHGIIDADYAAEEAKREIDTHIQYATEKYIEKLKTLIKHKVPLPVREKLVAEAKEEAFNEPQF